MNRESMNTAIPDLLPPARTREHTLGPTPARGLNLLAPVLSGLFGRAVELPEPPAVEPVEPPATPALGQSLVIGAIQSGSVTIDEETGDVEIVAEEVTIELEGITEFELDDDPDEALTIDEDAPDLDLDEAEEATVETAFGSFVVDSGEEEAESVVQWYGDDQSAPWERKDELDEGVPIDSAAGDEPDDIWLVEDDTAEEDLVLEADDATDLSTATESAIRQAPPPVSPWDLGAASVSGEAGERAARARAEWESLGQALSESLAGAGPPAEQPGPHGYDLTDERAAELDADEKSPFSGPVIPGTLADTTEPPVAELIRRLETFAASIREHGPGALTRAQTGDDRFDALLASIAAGFLAGRGG